MLLNLCSLIAFLLYCSIRRSQLLEVLLHTSVLLYPYILYLLSIPPDYIVGNFNDSGGGAATRLIAVLCTT
jgi:hypothetical protein